MANSVHIAYFLSLFAAIEQKNSPHFVWSEKPTKKHFLTVSWHSHCNRWHNHRFTKCYSLRLSTKIRESHIIQLTDGHCRHHVWPIWASFFYSTKYLFSMPQFCASSFHFISVQRESSSLLCTLFDWWFIFLRFLVEIFLLWKLSKSFQPNRFR